MISSLYSIIIILFMLLLGYILGKNTTDTIRSILINLIPKVVMILLFFMGIDIGWVFVDDTVKINVLWDALAFSSLISVFVFTLIIRKNAAMKTKKSQYSFFIPLFGCLKSVLFFVLGIVAYKYFDAKHLLVFVSVNAILYFLIFLVGVDLVSFSIRTLSIKHLKIPALTILGTVAACYTYSIISERSLINLLLSSSGYGWFTLSGPMITALKGPELGMFAFLTDIFREILSIILLYIMGSRQAHSAIGVTGAAALDSTLPFIKENCHADDVDYAIVSGFILTLLVPIFISILAAL